MKTEKVKVKMPTRFKVNIIIFFAMAVAFFIMPSLLFRMAFPNTESVADNYPSGGFMYVLNDICPCNAGDEECSGYFACGPDKANITYNLDNAPADKLENAKQLAYLDSSIETSRQGMIAMRIMLMCDVFYLLSFISLVVGIIYWNHCAAVIRR